jgi:hypothetical protein
LVLSGRLPKLDPFDLLAAGAVVFRKESQN